MEIFHDTKDDQRGNVVMLADYTEVSKLRELYKERLRELVKLTVAEFEAAGFSTTAVAIEKWFAILDRDHQPRVGG